MRSLKNCNTNSEICKKLHEENIQMMHIIRCFATYFTVDYLLNLIDLLRSLVKIPDFSC